MNRWLRIDSGATSYYEQDGVGSATSLTNAVAAIAQTYSYKTFGGIITSSGTLTNPIQYTGREFDSETDLHYYRARYYDAGVGRFLSEDEVGSDEGADLYVYVGNSPIDLRDPTGFYKLKGFSPGQQSQMSGAIQQAIKKLSESCPSCAGPDAPKIIKALETATYVYEPDADYCGETPPFHFLLHRINVAGNAFNPNKCCSLASTMTHEAAHLGAGASEPQAYKIEKDCFNCGTGRPPSKQ